MTFLRLLVRVNDVSHSFCRNYRFDIIYYKQDAANAMKNLNARIYRNLDNSTLIENQILV